MRRFWAAWTLPGWEDYALGIRFALAEARVIGPKLEATNAEQALIGPEIFVSLEDRCAVRLRRDISCTGARIADGWQPTGKQFGRSRRGVQLVGARIM